MDQEKTHSPSSERLRGVGGGLTTVSSDGALVRKTFYLDRDVEEVLRDTAHEQRVSEAFIVRQVLREHFGLEP